MYNMYPLMWKDYVCYLYSLGEHSLAVTFLWVELSFVHYTAGQHIRLLVQKQAMGDLKSNASVSKAYIGFDKRDIKDYNLTASDYHVHKVRSSHGISGMEDVPDEEASARVWALLVAQLATLDWPACVAVAFPHYHQQGNPGVVDPVTRAATVHWEQQVFGGRDVLQQSMSAKSPSHVDELLLALADIHRDYSVECLIPSFTDSAANEAETHRAHFVGLLLDYFSSIIPTESTGTISSQAVASLQFAVVFFDLVTTWMSQLMLALHPRLSVEVSAQCVRYVAHVHAQLLALTQLYGRDTTGVFSAHRSTVVRAMRLVAHSIIPSRSSTCCTTT